MLDTVEEALDEIALAVEPSRKRETLLSVGAGRDVGPDVLAGNDFTDGVVVIPLSATSVAPSGMASSRASASWLSSCHFPNQFQMIGKMFPSLLSFGNKRMCQCRRDDISPHRGLPP